MTDLRAFLRLTRAWMLGVTRERSTIFWLFAFPIIFVVVFGLAFGRSDVGSYSIGVAVDQSTPTGAALVQAFESVKPFKVSTGSAEAEIRKLRDGDRYAVVTTAAAASASQTPGAGQNVIIYLDPSRGSAEQIVLPIIHRVIDEVDRQLSGRTPQLTVEERSVRSEDLSYIEFFLPGIIGFSIMQAGMFAAIPLVQLRLTGVLKRFSATPVPRWTVLASQGLMRLLLAVVQTIVLLVVGWLLFDINFSANWLGAAAFVALGGLAFLGLGFALSGLARSEEAVPALVQAVSFPMMFLSGVFFPIESFPSLVQTIARLMPLTFLGDGLRQVMVGGASLNPLWVDYLVLGGWVLAAGALAVRFFKWE